MTPNHDGHTVNVGPVTVGVDTDAKDGVAELLGLRAENDRLQDLLAKALPWIDPNDSHEDYLLTVAIREALGEES